MTRPPPQNLLFISTDQQRPDTIGAYAPRRIFRGTHTAPSTPNLHRLAASVTLFENAYCATPGYPLSVWIAF